MSESRAESGTAPESPVAEADALVSRLKAIRDRLLDDRTISPGDAKTLLLWHDWLVQAMDAAEHAIEVGQTAALGWELKGDEYADVCARMASFERALQQVSALRDEWDRASPDQPWDVVHGKKASHLTYVCAEINARHCPVHNVQEPDWLRIVDSARSAIDRCDAALREIAAMEPDGERARHIAQTALRIGPGQPYAVLTHGDGPQTVDSQVNPPVPPDRKGSQ